VTVRWERFSGDALEGTQNEAEIIVKMILNGEPFYSIKQKLTAVACNRDEAYSLLDSMEVLFGRYMKERSVGIETIKTAIGCIEEARQDLRRGMQLGQSLKRMTLCMEV
jgi:hypothetical protein